MRNLGVWLFQAAGKLPIRWMRKLGAAIAAILFWQKGKTYQITKRNIEICFPKFNPEAKNQLIKATISQNTQRFLEIPYIWTAPESKIRALYGDCDLPKLQKHLDSSKGCLILAPHIGAWELLGYYLGWQSQNTSMYLPTRRSQTMSSFILRARSRFGNQLVPANRDGVKAFFQSIKAGEVVSILPDQSPTHSSSMIYSTFFEQRTATIVLPAKIAQKTKAPTLLAYCLFNPTTTKYDVHFEDVPDFGQSADIDHEVRRMNQAIESLVQQHPSEYLWTYKRFKRQPGEHPDFYLEPEQYDAHNTAADTC